MRKIIKEFNVYNFDELSDDVKKKLIEKERDIQKELYCEDCLYDDMEEKASNLLNDYFGITSDYLKVYYDLSYSQGSGAMIEFDIDILDLNNKYKVFSDEEIRFFKEKDVIDYIKIRHHDNFYCHEYTFNIDYFYYNDWEYDDIKEDYKITKSEFDTLEDRFYKLVDTYNKHNTDSQFVKDIISMNKELTKYGYECIEYFDDCSDDEIIGYIKDNEYEYLESGEIF